MLLTKVFPLEIEKCHRFPLFFAVSMQVSICLNRQSQNSLLTVFRQHSVLLLTKENAVVIFILIPAPALLWYPSQLPPETAAILVS
jgi:hypothetical protein